MKILKYQQLYDVIGTRYNTSVDLEGAAGKTFRLPDLRGRFPLGKHNMDNNQQVTADALAYKVKLSL